MPVINRIADFSEDMKNWRRHLHQFPELGFDLHETAGFVEERLREFGVDEIHPGIAKTGIVAIINGKAAGPTIGLRADMDALPIHETSGVNYASQVPGKMHACGHDGHTTMLLGAARYLAETRNFNGRVALIFQPAEEGDAGAKVMVDEDIMQRFEISQVYALHNMPGREQGHFFGKPGPIMAAVDTFFVDIQGRGGHGAYPQETADPVVAAAAMISAVQTIISRNHDTRNEAVCSVTLMKAGTADNIIPDTASFGGTIRTFAPEVQDMILRRLREVVAGQAAAFGVNADIKIIEGYPATVNSATHVEYALDAASDIVGETSVNRASLMEMGGEDFAYMLQERPGAYVLLGQGPGAGLHSPNYIFNDEISPVGASFFARLVEQLLPTE